jgi:PhzF family phenazine biosynthesis protein
MQIPIFKVDAFSSTLFSGNPAAVCPLPYWLDDTLLQAIAAENNLSETAFFVSLPDGGYHLRWFTPAAEVELCGHATLATAHVLFSHLSPELSRVHFQTRSGILPVGKNGSLIELDFPARKPAPIDPPVALINGLGVRPKKVLAAADYFVVYENEAAVRAIQPDFKLLAGLELDGVCITAPGDQADFCSRFFAPAIGVPEDPVTGSAHTMLTPYWAERLGKKELRAVQVSKRGGELFCQDRGERVTIAGQAVTFLKGFIEL